MEINVKFTDEELVLIFDALHLGVVHTTDDNKSKMMENLMEKIRILNGFNQLTKSH